MLSSLEEIDLDFVYYSWTKSGASRSVFISFRYPMFSHHQKSLGRDWTTPWENPQSCWNRHISSCMRWPGHYSRAPYPYFSSRHFSLNWRPPCLFESRTQFQYSNWRPDNLSQTSLIHLSSYIMNSEGDEPSSKRRKHQGKGDIYLGEEVDINDRLSWHFHM